MRPNDGYTGTLYVIAQTLRIIITIFLLSTSIASFGQEYKFEYGDEKYMDYHYNCSIDYGYTFKKRLQDGKYLGYHPNNPDLILVEAYYKNRKKNGDWKTYNTSNKTEEYRKYVNGQLNSEKHLDSLEQTTLAIEYRKQQQFGHYYSFYPDGHLKGTEEFWRHNRKSTQIITKYYPNGNVESVIRYKNNRGNTKPIGKWEYFYEDGKPESFEEFGRNWKSIGVWREWNEEGEIVTETDYTKQ
jgi:antitoxin component YwqK of YwqJK toxin-antitoxin module